MAYLTFTLTTIILCCSLAGLVETAGDIRCDNRAALPSWSSTLFESVSGIWCNDEQYNKENGSRQRICLRFVFYFNSTNSPCRAALFFEQTVDGQHTRCLLGDMYVTGNDELKYTGNIVRECQDSSTFPYDINQLRDFKPSLIDAAQLFPLRIEFHSSNDISATCPVPNVSGLLGSEYHLRLLNGVFYVDVPRYAPEKETQTPHILKRIDSETVELPFGI